MGCWSLSGIRGASMMRTAWYEASEPEGVRGIHVRER